MKNERSVYTSQVDQQLQIKQEPLGQLIPFRYQDEESFERVCLQNSQSQLGASKLDDLEKSNNQLKGALEMANLIAHNIKSPLMALELLVVSDSINEETKKTIRQTLNQTYEKINEINLLDSAEKLACRNYSMQKTDLNSLVKECFGDVTSLYDGKTDVEFRLHSGSEKMFGLVCPQYFKSAFLNVIKNSYESIEKNGFIEVTIESDKKNIYIRFSDNGRGVPMHLLPYLGQKKLTYGKKNGSGLGLYQVKKMVERCHGQFEITSQEKQGTTIQLSLPKFELPKEMSA